MYQSECKGMGGFGRPILISISDEQNNTIFRFGGENYAS